jgi:hypothetical protein
MKTKLTSLLIALIMLSFVKMNAQTSVTLTPTADSYTSCTSTDAANYGSDPYVKLAYNSNSTLKYNGFLRFRMTDELFANLANVTAIEFGIYSDGTGLTTARQVKVSYIPISVASPNTIWVESEINGVFRNGMGLGSGIANTSLFYFTKADSDPAKTYIVTSSATSNSAMYNAIVNTYKIQQEINLRLYPNESFTTDGKNPNTVDASGINFVSKDNTSFTSDNYPYLKFTYSPTTGLNNEVKNIHPVVVANSNGFRIVSNTDIDYLNIYTIAGSKIFCTSNCKASSQHTIKIPLGIYICKTIIGSSEFSQKIQVTK